MSGKWNWKRSPVMWGAAVVCAAGFGLAGLPSQPVSALERADGVAMLRTMSDTFSDIAEEASKSVVHIRIEKEMAAPASMGMRGGIPEPLQRFFGIPGMPDGEGMPYSDGPVPVGEGSGFIVSSDGYIVTNNHVVGEADRVKVTLNDGRELTAELVGTDPATDVALIKVDATGLPAAKLGNSDDLRVGEWVLAIGSPFGLSQSVSQGIISARGRGDVRITEYSDFIQTDAAINPGNSGGPLLNLDGEVVGINTAILSRTGGSAGVGFAIPVNVAKFVEEQIRDHGAVTRGFLGVLIQPVTPEIAQWFDVPAGRGALVAEVQPDSPAAKAGLEPNDVIIDLNGEVVEQPGSFSSRIASSPAGKSVDLTILRDGKERQLTAKLGAREGEEEVTLAGPAASEGTHKLGIALQDLTPDIAKQLGYAGNAGVVISDVQRGSRADRAGIEPGTVVKEVNKKAVSNTAEFKKALSDTNGNDSALLLVEKDGHTRYIAIEVD